MSSLIESFTHWVTLHPHLTGLIAGIIAFTESLAFVGLVVPGSTLLLAAGALIGAGLVDFWSLFAWAVGGAIVGDGVSYWIGHRYRDRLGNIGIIKRHPQWLAHGNQFFKRHGGKSVILARFVGPVRPIIPVLAGMLGMSPVRFYYNNILSALVWAASHLLVGMLVGASLVLAGQVATRLAIVLGAFIVSVWFILWLVHRIYLQLHPRLAAWIQRILKWCSKHPRLAWLFTDLYEPERPAVRALAIWLLVLLGSLWLFFEVLGDAVNRNTLLNSGQALNVFLHQLRTPLGDNIMLVFTELGDFRVTLPVALTVILWLLWQRAWRDALYWVGALGFGLLAVPSIHLISWLPHPIINLGGGGLQQFSGGHVTLSTVIYGLLAVFIASPLHPRWRWPVYAVATLLIVAITFSRIYLGSHWLANILAGLALATSGISLLAIAYTRHRRVAVTGYALPAVVGLVFLSAATLQVYRHFDADRARYSLHIDYVNIDTSAWQQDSWRKFPAWRHDLRGVRSQPMNLQWAGHIDTIRQQLLNRGWEVPKSLNARTSLAWLLPHPKLKDLPVLPQLHDGLTQALVLIHPDTDKQAFILRLWPTHMRLGDGTPLWVGTVMSLHVEHLPLISFLRLNAHYTQALDLLQKSLPSNLWRLVQRSPSKLEPDVPWQGTVMLIDTHH